MVQSHLGTTVPADFQANLKRSSDLGVDVQITELDIQQGSNQPAAYTSTLNALNSVSTPPPHHRRTARSTSMRRTCW